MDDDAATDEDGEDVRRWARELIVAREGELYCDAEALDRHDRDGADERADGYVHDRIGPAVSRDNDVDHDEAEDEHDQTVEHEACVWCGP